ncbi:CCA tRNA nucleotidyltransferase [Malassezia cuniculi]|uniref:CCA tRNA nucleotidyltransferase n=1 Tax=Malassezia cuniculi TaxID=948313 RepID=A0AAF0JBX3_9BASI|nr:CCA tRNA nucleotidyltransferase [Malassezia cuniculi]
MSTRIQLSPVESTICSLLDHTCRWIGATDPAIELDGAVRRFSELRHATESEIACEARIAGGWVRDKLLHKASHDLDVSLSSVTGHVFALLLREYLYSDAYRNSPLAQQVAEHMPDSSAESMSGIGRIAANPEQSKNLETATARVFGVDLDFVNLRKEAYEGDSRIPTMSFGTPKEDAERRDITINSLFYNVHTREIEDWTQFGLDDLAKGIVRTPLEPAETFSDDPLRILRCIRFASRFGYRIHDDIVACLTGGDDRDRLRADLSRKVSRERFGIEIDKMIQGPDPLHALQLISELGLYDIVFLPPPPSDEQLITSDGVHVPPSLDESAALAAGRIFNEIVRDDTYLPSDWREALQTNHDEVRRYLWFAIALIPLRKMHIKVNKTLTWAGAITISNGLKLGTKNTRKPVNSYYDAANLLSRPLLDRFRGELSLAATIGLLVRSPDITQPSQYVSLAGVLLFSMLLDLVPYADKLSAAGSVFDEYTAFWRFAQEHKLEQHALEKPVVDGKRIVAVLQCEPILIRAVQPFVYAWQIDNAAVPADQQREECEKWLASEWEAGRIVPPEERSTDTKRRRGN